MALGNQRRARFGPFEFDPRTGELYGSEGIDPLPRQVSQLLEILIEHAPDIATREEIRKRLWSETNFIEFEVAIRAATRKLRKALGDSAQEPRYIETIPRFGYRLRVPVEWVDAPPAISRPNRPFQVDKLSGMTISHYRLGEIIGRGGMGVVYCAQDLHLPRSVALKFLPEELSDDLQAHARLKSEACAISTIDHPNICSIYEFDEYEGRPFIAMQLLHGQTLRDRLQAGQLRLSTPEGLEIAIQIAHGLEAAHANGIVHRDIKPANIFITEKDRVKILDFGVALLLDAGEAANVCPLPNPAPSTTLPLHPQSSKSMKFGTAGFMSPEQIRGEPLDARTDIFSFGLVLYQMATGDRAFNGDRETVEHAILNLEPHPLKLLAPEISPQLEAIIGKCLQKRREDRYAIASEVISALEDVRIVANTKRQPPGILGVIYESLAKYAKDKPVAVLHVNLGREMYSVTLTENMENLTIGRSSDCVICLGDALVSRFHCRLHIDKISAVGEALKLRFTLIDAGSRYGIRFKGKEVRLIELQDGDLFEVGTTRFMFKLLQ